MSIHNAIGGASVKNNSGVGFGLRYSADLLGSVALGLEAARTGSVVVDGDNTDSAIGGIFAYNNATPIAKRVTTELASISNDFLLSGAAKPDLVVSVHRIEGITTRRIATAVRAGYWNIYTGQWSTNPTNTADSFTGSDSTSNDYAARVSRSFPGRLTYKLGNPEAVTVGYAPKTN